MGDAAEARYSLAPQLSTAMQIHPTALVADGAQLADDVVIGPGSIVSAESVIGPGCMLGAHVILEHRVVLGANTKVGHGSIIGADPQDLAFDAARTDCGVRIGSNNVLREYVTIHRATAQDGDTTLGDGNFLMTGAHLAHDTVVGNNVVMANNVLLAGHVQVHDGVFIGGGAVFHQFMRIGRLAMVRGGCRFSKDIAPFLVGSGENNVAGLNVVGLRRAGLGAGLRAELKRAFLLLYASRLNVTQAVAAAAEQEWGPEAKAFWDFVAGSGKRGLCDYAGRAGEEE